MHSSSRIHRNVLVSALGVALLASAATPLLRSAPPQRDDYRRSGELVGWRVDMDGTLYIRLSPATVEAGAGAEADPDPERYTWFRTPPDKALERNVEEVLVVLLASDDVAAGRKPITVTAKLERALDGKSPEKALPLSAVASP